MFYISFSVNPKNPCLVEKDFATQRKHSLHFSAVFVPECDMAGNYKPLQQYGSTGERWCVVPTTGKLVDGTKRKPGESDPVCDGGGMIRKRFYTKVYSVCLLSPSDKIINK